MPSGTKAQRLEAAGALDVVLEQEAVDRQLAEHALGDRLVVALAEPHARLVAAADVHADRVRPVWTLDPLERADIGREHLLERLLAVSARRLRSRV